MRCPSFFTGFLNLLIAFYLLGLSTNCNSQEDLSPQFDVFRGAVYQLPYDSLPLGYQPYIEYLVPSKHVEWDEIFVRESSSAIPFPDVHYKSLFGIIFNTKMRIAEDGNYEFVLVSDDGSNLWIDGQLVIDNDKPHPIRIKRDTVALRKGEYPVKIWYYQAYPNAYGIMFTSNYIGPAQFAPIEPIVWNGDILFEFDNHQLSEPGLQLLDSLVLYLKDRWPSEIRILGHTDNIGNSDYNYRLSQRRAETIKEYLEKITNRKDIVIRAIGFGEDKPRVPNSNSTNRALNRRVEFQINQ